MLSYELGPEVLDPNESLPVLGEAALNRPGAVPEGSASAKALDYSLRRWEALTRFVDDGQLPADNGCIRARLIKSPGPALAAVLSEYQLEERR